MEVCGISRTFHKVTGNPTDERKAFHHLKCLKEKLAEYRITILFFHISLFRNTYPTAGKCDL